jgi:hypothetical protein
MSLVIRIDRGLPVFIFKASGDIDETPHRLTQCPEVVISIAHYYSSSQVSHPYRRCDMRHETIS